MKITIEIELTCTDDDRTGKELSQREKRKVIAELEQFSEDFPSLMCDNHDVNVQIEKFDINQND